MKLIAAVLCLLCLQSHAEIVQHSVVMDMPSVSVRPGEQRNGTLAIEQLFTKTTTAAQETLSNTMLATSNPASFGGSGQRSAPAVFSSVADITLPNTILPPPAITKPVSPGSQIVSPVPEPESYTLMALGLSALLLARRQRSLHSQTAR